MERTKRWSICTAVAFEESDMEVNLMRVFWERTGVLGPIYRLAGQGLSDVDIANKLNLTEVKVRGCVTWILRFLRFTDRSQLVQYTSTLPARPVRHELKVLPTACSS